MQVQHSGQIILFGHFTYEHIRNIKEGEGIAITAIKKIMPVFVSDEGEEAEAVTIDIQVRDMTLSVISAFGPQDSAPSEKKTTFCAYLTKETQRAKALGKGFVLQGDLNAWLGPSFIKVTLMNKIEMVSYFPTSYMKII